MKITPILKLLVAVGAVFVSLNSQAQTVKTTIPAAAAGTYEMTYDFASAGSPYKNGDKVTFVINSTNGTLCVGGLLLSNPFLRRAGESDPLWAKPESTTYFGAALLTTGALSEINVFQGTNDTWAGQFTGARTSTSTACSSSTSSTGGSTAVPTVTASVQSVFDLAAEIYPTMFKNGGALGTYLGYVYKYFADSKIYVGIKDDKIYTMGGVYGTAITEQGSVAAVLNLLQTTKANLLKSAGSTSLYKLTLSGNFKTSGFASVNIPISGIVINDLPAPDVSNTTAILDQVKTSLVGVTGIANVKVTSVNNTASRVTFRVEFTAVLAGFGTVTYDLTYDYTK